jgi:hypothetical protein
LIILYEKLIYKTLKYLSSLSQKLCLSVEKVLLEAFRLFLSFRLFLTSNLFSPKAHTSVSEHSICFLFLLHHLLCVSFYFFHASVSLRILCDSVRFFFKRQVGNNYKNKQWHQSVSKLIFIELSELKAS